MTYFIEEATPDYHETITYRGYKLNIYYDSVSVSFKEDLITSFPSYAEAKAAVDEWLNAP